MPTTLNPSDQTITQYNIQTGGASNLLNNVAPSATSGVPVISQGASAQPIFGTAVVAGGGTGQVTLTNHGVLVGAATAAITQLVAGSAGQVLQSGGASADPAYSTATYPAVATGTGTILRADGTNWVATTATYPATTTANQILFSSATNVVGGISNGTTGQVLIATTGSAPSFGAVPSSFTPNATMQLVDDFLGCYIEASGHTLSSQLSWGYSTVQTWTPLNAVASTNPGIVAMNFTLTAAASSVIWLNPGSGAAAVFLPFILGSGIIQLNFVIDLTVLSNSTNRYTLRCGLGDTVSGADQVNGVYLEYSDNINSGNWNYKTSSASTRTTTNSSTAVGTGWQNLGITINAAASSVSFTVNGVSLGAAITTNIPSTGTTIFLAMTNGAGTNPTTTIYLDLVYMTYAFTSAR